MNIYETVAFRHCIIKKALCVCYFYVIQESLKKDSLNGFMYANGPPFQVCTGERVVWYMLSLEAETHVAEIHGHTFDLKYRRSVYNNASAVEIRCVFDDI